jgi:hypothetical protein
MTNQITASLLTNFSYFPISDADKQKKREEVGETKRKRE